MARSQQTVMEKGRYLKPTHTQETKHASAESDDPNECLNCGTRYDKTYRRVFGDRDDRLHACPECESQIAMKRGKGAGK